MKTLDDRPPTEPEGLLWEIEDSEVYRPVWQIEGMPETVETLLRAPWLEAPRFVLLDEVRQAMREAIGSDRLPESIFPLKDKAEILWLRLAINELEAGFAEEAPPPAWWRTDQDWQMSRGNLVESLENYLKFGRGYEWPDMQFILGEEEASAELRRAYGELVSLVSFVIQDWARPVKRDDPAREQIGVLIEQGVRHAVSLRMAEALQSPAAPILQRLRPLAELGPAGRGGLALIADPDGPLVELRLPIWSEERRLEIRETIDGAPIRVATLTDGKWMPLKTR